MLKIGQGKFEGFIEGSRETYYFYLHLPQFPSFESATLKTCWNLKLLLDNDPCNIISSINCFNTVEEFHKALESRVYANGQRKKLSHEFYTNVYKELVVIGPAGTITSDFSCVEFSASDIAGRCHTAVISLPDSYPQLPVRIESHELPIRQEASLGTNPDFSCVKTITQAYNQFLVLIQIFQSFWDAMDILDSSCWISEPQKPVYSDIFRRIQISESCSVLLTFNPYNPNQRPAFEFRGDEEKVEMFRNSLEKNLVEDNWDTEVDIHLNLLSVLDLDTFPMKENVLSNEIALIQPGECGICFEDRLDGNPANQRCDNARCNSQYHQVCLLKYLFSNLSNVRVKNAVLGRCPTCRDPIGCTTLSWSHFQ